MKLDPQKIRQLREERSWTQEHLATVAGLSLRTVQRIEREGNGSSDSRLALAAAFGVDLSRISDAVENTAVASAPSPAESPMAHDVLLPKDPKREFLQHLGFYLLGSLFFLGGDLWQNRSLTWAHWPLLGWGAGLALHGRHAWAQLHRPASPSDAGRTRRRAFLEHIAAWAVLSAVFVVADLLQNGTLTWAFYPMVAWAAGLYTHRRALDRSSP